MIEPDVEAAPPKGIANAPFLIGCKDDERNRLGLHRSELWDAELPIAENLEKQSLELLIDLVDFIDQEHTRFVFVQESSQQRSFREELQAVQLPTQSLPITITVCSHFEK